MSELAYVNLTFDGQSLLLPQTEVHHVELTANIQAAEGEADSLGIVEHDGHEWQVHVLGDELSPLNSLPSQRRLVACIATGEQRLALACDMLTTARFVSEYIIDELPEMMRANKSPIQSLLYTDRKLHYVSSAQSLSDCLQSGEE